MGNQQSTDYTRIGETGGSDGRTSNGADHARRIYSQPTDSQLSTPTYEQPHPGAEQAGGDYFTNWSSHEYGRRMRSAYHTPGEHIYNAQEVDPVDRPRSPESVYSPESPASPVR